MPSPSKPAQIAVLGAGLTGLSAAYHLTRSGHHVTLFEASDRAGGVIQSDSQNGWLIERGPNSLQENARELTELFTALGLDAAKVGANAEAKKRFIVRDGKLCVVPLSPPALIGTSLISFASKIRLAKEILFARPKQRGVDLPLATMIREHFGSEIVDVLLNPFVSGVYAGNAERLSAQWAFPTLWEGERTHGSLIKAQMAQAKARRAQGEPKPQIISFRQGLQALPDALAAQLPEGTLKLRAKVLRLLPGASWQVNWMTAGETHSAPFDAVVSTLPAIPLSQLDIGPESTRPLARLANIEHPPVASLFLGFRRDQVSHPLDGFGALIPARENRKILGVLFSSTLFPGRAPEGHVALTVLCGGTQRPELARLGQDELISELLPELGALLGVRGDPVFRRLNVWPRAIPQYNLGHERFLAEMTACSEKYPGFYAGGQVSDGISLPNCLNAGQKLARAALFGMQPAH